MSTLLQIYFQSGTFENPEGATTFWSFLVDILKAVIGPFIGFCGAWFIFRNQTKYDRDKIETQRKQLFKDKLQYFASLVADIPGIIKSQAEFYKTFSNTTLENKFIINVPQFIIKTTITRLTEKSNQEDYFLAYINQFEEPKTRKKEIDNFKEIFRTIDYYDILLTQSVESVKDLKARIKKAMEEFKIATEDVEKFAASLLNTPSFTDTNENFANYISDLFLLYTPQKQQNVSNLTFHFDNFLSDIADKIDEIGGYVVPEINQLALKVRDARINYSHIEFLSNQQAEEFLEYSNELLDPLNDFVENTKTLKKINEMVQ